MIQILSQWSNYYKEILTIISLFLIVILFKTSHTTKMNISEIVKCHISTLKLFGHEEIYSGDIKLFFLLPIVTSFLINMYIKLDDTKIGIIVTAFTIFVGLLFNILAILLAFNDEKKKYLDKKLIKEILYNVSFSIIVSIMVIILSIFRLASFNCIIYRILDFILFYLVLVFIFGLFMILKRLFNLLLDKIDKMD